MVSSAYQWKGAVSKPAASWAQPGGCEGERGTSGCAWAPPGTDRSLSFASVAKQ